MGPPTRSDIRPGIKVRVVEKHNQQTGILTTGIVKSILTKSNKHPHGIKVVLANGKVGRVKSIDNFDVGSEKFLKLIS